MSKPQFFEFSDASWCCPLCGGQMRYFNDKTSDDPTWYYFCPYCLEMWKSKREMVINLGNSDKGETG